MRHEHLLTTCSEETEAGVVRACLPIIRPGKDRRARHCERSEEKGETKGSGGKTTSESGQRGLWKTDKDAEAARCKIIGGLGQETGRY